MGEAKSRRLLVHRQVVEALGLQTANGPLKVRLDGKAKSTTFGQMEFFIEFLTATRLSEKWVGDCPLEYKSPNGSSRGDIWDVDVDSLRPLALRAYEHDPR